ncbi:MAG: hypothetical protein JWR32_4999 [Mycobacterium sp.]|jgi:quinol monooxygenase YgiN|nr:hypothetical protein [Mycobacterium sp.]
MLQWETVDPEATYPFERYKVVSGNREYRIFYDPGASQVLPWILVVREVWEDGAHVHIHHGTYRTVDEVKRAAGQWEGPPPPEGMTGRLWHQN